MATRASCKGYLRLNLVSCAVALHGALSGTSRLHCHTLNRATGNRLRDRMVDEATGDEVPREDRMRGCSVDKLPLVEVTKEEMDQIRLETTHTLTIEQFCDRADIDQRYLEKPYYLVPQDRVSGEAFAVIRDAMRRKKVTGLGRLVLWRKERVMLVEPWENGMLATLLRAGDEVRRASGVLAEMERFDAPAEMRGLAEELIERARKPFDPGAFADRYEQALIQLVERKAGVAKGRDKAAVSRPRAVPGDSAGLMAALKRSLAAAADKSSADPAASPKASAKAADKAPAGRARRSGRQPAASP